MNKYYKVIENEIEYEIEEDSQGSKWWSLNNQLHRENGPAVELCDGYKVWYKYNKIHRTDGPARIYSNRKEYWLNDSYYSNDFSDNEWIIFQIIT